MRSPVSPRRISRHHPRSSRTLKEVDVHLQLGREMSPTTEPLWVVHTVPRGKLGGIKRRNTERRGWSFQADM